jgi:GT2 family glycosyltransferase
VSATDAGRLAVVLVHREQPRELLATVAAFRADLPVAIVVVDNGSSPAVLAELEQGLPHEVSVLRLGANTGFGPGANAGLRWALERGHELVAVAPHDALPDPGCLAALVAALHARPHAGLVSADVGDGHRPHVDPYFGGITLPRTRDEGWEDCHYPHGTLFLARRACLEEVGLFDERYFAYCEEADLGLRARAAGWEVGIVQGARVRNPGMGGTSAAADYLMARNTLLLVREHSGRYHAFIRAALLVGQIVGGTVRPSSRPWIFSARGRAWALLDHGRRRYGPPPARLTRP